MMIDTNQYKAIVDARAVIGEQINKIKRKRKPTAKDIQREIAMLKVTAELQALCIDINSGYVVNTRND